MSEVQAPPPSTGKIDHIGRWVLVATISASSMAFIMQSALNLALPSIQIELGASGADILWIVNVYQLLLGALILVGGSLGDHYGRRRVYMIGIALFTVATILAGFAPTTGLMILARAIQGIGGALMVPGSLAIVASYFDDNTRGTAIGIWSSFTTMTSVLGPVLGGMLTDVGLWRLIFFLTVPLALASLYALQRYVPESKDDEAPRELDYAGAFFITIGMGGIVYGATEIGRAGLAGWTNPVLVGALVLGIIALVLFIRTEQQSAHPMLSLSLFKSRTFSGANLLTLFLYGALGGALFFLPLNLIQVQGYGATVAGLALLPFSILLILLSPFMGRFVDKYGARLPLVVGSIIVGFSFVALAIPEITAGVSDYWTTFFPAGILLGVGMGMVVAPLTNTVMSSVSRHQTGVASGVNNAVSRSAGVLATAILGGIALIIFAQNLTLNVNALEDVPSDVAQALIANANDLAAAAIPNTATALQAEALQLQVDLTFVATFRVIMLIAAVMCWVAAVMAWWWIERD
jgi:EmrB/QacA subfamily drug resistance transporter